MAKKGYWVGSVEVSDLERYKDYISTATPAYQRFEAKFLGVVGISLRLKGRLVRVML